MRKRRTNRYDTGQTIKTPKQINHPHLSDSERLFCWLYCVIGMTQAESYKLSMTSQATMSSCSAMASRMLQENDVKEYMALLEKYFNSNPLEVKIKK